MNNVFYTSKIRIFVASLVIMLMTPLFASAGFWGEAIASQILKQSMEEATRKIHSIINATTTAIILEGLSVQVDQVLSSSGGKITDWQDYLFLNPQQEAFLVTDNLMTAMTRGTGMSGLSGDIEGESLRDRQQDLLQGAMRRLQRQANTGFSEPIDAVSYFRGDTTTSPHTGKITAFGTANDPSTLNMSGFNALLADPSNTFMIASVAEQMVGNIAQQGRVIASAKQTHAGYDVANPLQASHLRNSFTETLMNTLVDGSRDAAEQEILRTVISALIKKSLDGADGNVLSLLEKSDRAIKELERYYNKDARPGEIFQIRY